MSNRVSFNCLQASSRHYSVRALWKTVGRHGHSFSYVRGDIYTYSLFVLRGNVFNSVPMLLLCITFTQDLKWFSVNRVITCICISGVWHFFFTCTGCCSKASPPWRRSTIVIVSIFKVLHNNLSSLNILIYRYLIITL